MKFEHIFYATILIGIAAVLIFSYIYFVKPSEQESSPDFQVDSVLLKTTIKLDGSFDEGIRITNMRDEKQHFEISVIGLGDFVAPDLSSFDLNANDIGSIRIIFSNKNKKPEGVYVGILKIKSPGFEEDIPVILEIESKDVLFDSSVVVYPQSKIPPGGTINAQIKIFDLTKIGTSSVEMGYLIQNFKGEEISSETESVVVKDQVLVSKSIQLPDNIREGDYVFSVILKYKGTVSTSALIFPVAKESTNIFSFIDWRYLVIIAVLLFVVLLGILLEYERRKMRDVISVQGREIGSITKRIRTRKVKSDEAGDISKKISKQMITLESAFKSGYITRGSYNKGMKRLKDVKKKIKEKYL